MSQSLEIGAGGYVSTDPPASFYGSEAVLVFNQGASATYDVNSNDRTWSTTVVPNSITINSGKVRLNDNRTASGELIVNSGATLETNAGKQLTINGNITNNGTLTLKSDASNGTATLLNNGTLSGTGTYNVEQYLTSGRNWYVSSPVNAAQSGMFTSNASNKLWERNIEANSWTPITATDVTLQPMRGYVANVASSGVVTFSGSSINTGEKSVGLTTFEVTSGKFNLVGNPYPSHITWNESMATGANTLTTIWYRTYVASAYAFHTFNASGNVGTPGTVTGVIPPMQAFWVRVNDEGAPSPLVFNNTHRSHAATSNPLKAPAALSPLVRLVVSNGQANDEAVVYFNENASDGYDAYDSPKMFVNSASVPEIYTRVGNEQLVINGMSQIYPGLEMPLGFRSGQTNTFTLRASQLRDMDADIRLILIDKVANTEFDLTAGDAYSFTSDAVNTEDRFAIQFRSSTGTTGICCTHLLTGTSVYSVNGAIIVNCNNDIAPNARLSVFNSVGQIIHTQSVNNYQTTTARSFDAGVYLVKVENGGRSVVLRTIVR